MTVRILLLPFTFSFPFLSLLHLPHKKKKRPRGIYDRYLHQATSSVFSGMRGNIRVYYLCHPQKAFLSPQVKVNWGLVNL